MADLWLEKELARQLAPVTAPESLWDRINRQPLRPPRRVLHVDRAFWPVAVVMLLLAVAGVVRTIRIDRDPGTLTDRELALVVSGAGASGAFDFRSDSFEITRKWVKAAANIDIDLPAGQRVADHNFVRLLGVRMTKLRGLPVAAIDYRVGDQVATLFVSGKHAGPAGNEQLQDTSSLRQNPPGTRGFIPGTCTTRPTRSRFPVPRIPTQPACCVIPTPRVKMYAASSAVLHW